MALNHAAARLASKRRKLASTTSDAPTLPVQPPAPHAPTTKTQNVSNLAWKNIVLPSEFGFDEDGGLLELDEVEGVDVVYGEGLVTFRVRDEGEAGSTAPGPPTKLSKKQKEANKLAALIASKPSTTNDSPFEEEDLSVFAEKGEDPEQGAVDEFEGKVVQAVKVRKEDVVDAPVTVEKPKVVAVEEKKGKGKKGKAAAKKENAEGNKLEGDDDESEKQLVEERIYDPASSLPAWSHLSLPEPIRRALFELKFEQPTAIQERALSVEIGAKPYVEPPPRVAEIAREEDEEEEWGGIVDEDDATEKLPAPEPEPYVSMFEVEPPTERELHPNTTDRDIVGVAQTGSGKTLAYGLPILSWILASPPPTSTSPQADPNANAESMEVDSAPYTRLAALILAPTRELALQVRAALSEIAIRTNPVLPPELQDPNINAPRKRVRGRHVSVVALTGGMSIEKQKRQLSRGADILVATPGRLWDLIGEDDTLARSIKGIKFLVIDEADRMIENGHFAELDNIVRLTRRKAEEAEDVYEDDFASAVAKHSKVDTLPPREDMRTFVFSATMSKDLQRNLKKRNRRYMPGQPEDSMSSLDDLLLKLDFRDPDPELIDLSPEGGLVETLKECKIECLLPEKDVHLYHFLLRYPGRTIVFLSSIDGIRRLHPLLVLLGLNVVPLHSGMQQRARLKSLDRFKASPNAILLATDVAARGLDIPSVAHVVHYTLPRSADVYVHRSGRTARAGQEGLALQLCAPEEKTMQRLLMASLGKDTDLPELPSDFSILDKLKERIELAKKIESAMHKATKEAHEENWVKQAAEAMDIEIDSDMEYVPSPPDSILLCLELTPTLFFHDSFSEGEDTGRKSRKQAKSKAAKVKLLKAELQAMLDKPLMMRGVSAKYITTRGRVDLVDQLVGGTSHSLMLGIQSSTALEDLPKSKKRPRPSSKK